MTEPTAVPRKILAEADFVFVPVELATSPERQGYYVLLTSQWWIVHPERGLAFWNPRNTRTGRRRYGGDGAPSCNANESITRNVIATRPRDWQCEVLFMPKAFHRIDINDYRQD